MPSRQIARLKELGFETVAGRSYDTLDAAELSETLKRRLAKSKYAIDGLVIKQDKRYKLETSGNPSYAVAFKQNAEDAEVEATVVRVEWNPSRTGQIKPTIIVKPVQVGGAIVARATGHNAKFIKDNKIAQGAIIGLVRSGEVIPYVTRVIQPAAQWQEPDFPYTWDTTRTNVLLLKGADDTVKVKQLVHLFNGLGIEGLKEATIKKLIDSGLTDEFQILQAPVSKLKAIGEANAQKLHKNIQQALSKKFTRAELAAYSGKFDAGLGLLKFRALEKAYPAWYPNFRFDPATAEEKAANVSGFSKASAAKIAKGIQDFGKWLLAMENAGIQLNLKPAAQDEQEATPTGELSGTSFLFTGIRDREGMEKAKQLGAQEAGSIKDATVLVAKDAEGNSAKLQAARKKGIRVITIKQFRDLIDK